MVVVGTVEPGSLESLDARSETPIWERYTAASTRRESFDDLDLSNGPTGARACGRVRMSTQFGPTVLTEVGPTSIR